MLTQVFLLNLDPIPEPTLILVPIYYEIESPIVDSHISLMDHECELTFFDLKPTTELKLTLKPKLDLSHIPSQYWFLFLSHSWAQINRLTNSLHC